MTLRARIYQPEYKNSHALVIGINRYHHASPLAYAENDATEIARALKEKHSFAENRVQLLLGDDATADNIRKMFLGLATDPEVGEDDRIMVFFAGHGHTILGGRGEVGYLVPVDGSTSNLASLIRWDELTRNADLIKAKHVLFVMDACYGGLALMRAGIPSGSHRFVKDMLQRYSRQVLTAGKADEVVSDGDGPRPGHSIFTGHVLDALEHISVTADNLLTANSLMSLVYQKVGRDPHSRQTPHYGFLDGDGDFVFDLASISGLGDGKADKDVLAKISSSVAS